MRLILPSLASGLNAWKRLRKGRVLA